jgi:NitT/TauT family transport system substrate-binding protein
LLAAPLARASRADAPNDPIHITIGYQPYYTGAWGALVVKERELWKKYLPPGSTIDWEVGLQGSVITNNMLAGKYDVGYVGDMPAIVAATKRSIGDIRLLALTSYNEEQCNNLLVRPDAPAFRSGRDALQWLNGKTVGITSGTCTDRFARAIFQKQGVQPGQIVNEGLEALIADLRAGKLDAAFSWEPAVSHVSTVVGNGSARLVSTGADWGAYDAGLFIVRKDFLDQHPDAVDGLLKAEIEAQRFILANYPRNACDVVGYAQSNTTGFSKRELWNALYGATVVDDNRREDGVRWSAHLIFDPTAKKFINDSSTFLLNAKVIAQPLPGDAILDGPLSRALGELHVHAPLGVAPQHAVASYPCG